MASMIEQPGNEQEKQINKQFSYTRIAAVIALSLGISAYLIYTSFDYKAISHIQWAQDAFGWLAFGALMMVARHIGYMYRLRLITDNKLSWYQSFNVISLWEFSSAITPSTVGGAAIAIYFMKKEKLSLGKSAATSMLTIFLDQVFLAAGGLILFVLLGGNAMFATDAQCRSQSELPMMSAFHNMQTIYFLGYGLFAIIISLLAYGLFINAHAFKSLLSSLFSLPMLKKWRSDALQTGDDMILTSHELKHKSKGFWWKLFISTAITWIAFFMIPICIVHAFFDPTLADLPVIFSRMFAIWMLMLLPISPGGAGIAELTFSAMMCDFTDPALVATLALLWRLLSFYPYLLLGVVILPRWVNRKYNK